MIPKVAMNMIDRKIEAEFGCCKNTEMKYSAIEINIIDKEKPTTFVSGCSRSEDIS